MKAQRSDEAESAQIEVIEDNPDRDAFAGWRLDIFVLSGSIFLIAIGLLTTLRPRFARWRVRNTSDGTLWRALFDEDRAVSAAQTFFGPNAVALGLIGLIAVVLGWLVSC